MDTTKVAGMVSAPRKTHDVAHGHLGENKCDSRIFGSSWRGDYIFTVR